MIASVSQSDNIKIEANLYTTETDHLKVMANQKPLLNHPIGIPDTPAMIEFSGLVESCYPLINRNKCWGMIRFLHMGEIEQINFDLHALASFLGNALYSFACGDTNKSQI